MGGGRADVPTLGSVRVLWFQATGVRPPLAVTGRGGATEEKLVPIHGVQAYLKPAARTARACLVSSLTARDRRCGVARATERPAGGPPESCNGWMARAPDRWAVWEDPSAGP